jgi:hypothetical protein
MSTSSPTTVAHSDFYLTYTIGLGIIGGSTLILILIAILNQYFQDCVCEIYNPNCCCGGSKKSTVVPSSENTQGLLLSSKKPTVEKKTNYVAIPMKNIPLHATTIDTSNLNLRRFER